MSYIIIVIIYNVILSCASESNSFLCAWKIQSPPATKKLYGCIQPSGMPSWPNTSTIFSFRFLTAPHWHRYFPALELPFILGATRPQRNASLRCTGGSSLSWWKLVPVGVPFLGHIYIYIYIYISLFFFCEVIPIISTTCWSKHVFVVAIEIISFLGSLQTFRDIEKSSQARFAVRCTHQPRKDLVLSFSAVEQSSKKMGEHGRTCRVCPDYWGPHTTIIYVHDMYEWHIVHHKVRWSLEGTVVDNLGQLGRLKSLAQVLEMRCGVWRFPDLAESGLLGPHIAQTSLGVSHYLLLSIVYWMTVQQHCQISWGSEIAKTLPRWWVVLLVKIKECKALQPCRNIVEVHKHYLGCAWPWRTLDCFEGIRICIHQFYYI